MKNLKEFLKDYLANSKWCKKCGCLLTVEETLNDDCPVCKANKDFVEED